MKSRLSIARWLALAALATLSFQPATAGAQTTAFTYQGRLNANGSAANGLYDLRFEAWDAPTNGNMVAGPLTDSAIGVTNGLFSVTLDFGPGVFTGPGRWLELDVRTNGNGAFTTLLPLQQILPTPYSIMANTASNLLGTLPAAQLSGTLPSSVLAGYSGPVAFTNPADTFIGAFSGDASGLTNFSNASSTSDGSITSNLFVQVSVNPAMRANAAPRPPMGYAAVTLNTEATWIGIAQYFNSSGLAQAGYTVMGIDAGWCTNRDANGALVPILQFSTLPAYTHGMPYLVSVFQTNGCSLGLYIAPASPWIWNPADTSNLPSSDYAHAALDAKTLVDWGATFVKIDNSYCGFGPAGEQQWLETFAAAADNESVTAGWTNQQPSLTIDLSIGRYLGPWVLGVANLINCGGDPAQPTWAQYLDGSLHHPWVTGPGHYQYQQGLITKDYWAAVAPTNGIWGYPLTTNDTRGYFAMSCMAAMPLFIAVQPPYSATELAIFKNPDAIAIDQDTLCIPGHRVQSNADAQVWVKPLLNGDVAVALWNRNTNSATAISVPLSVIPGLASNKVAMLDVFDGLLTSASGTLSATVNANGVNLYRLSRR
jgi:hypothetical protein